MPPSDASPTSPTSPASLAALVGREPGPPVPGSVTRAPDLDDLDDLDAVIALLATAAMARPGASPPVRREDLRIRWLMLDDPGDAVLIGPADGGAQLLAYASAPVDIEVDPVTAAVEAVVHLEGEVHPAHRGRGLGTFLLDRAVATGRAALDGVEEPGARTAQEPDAASVQVRVRTALVDGTPAEHAWFAARGFTAVRHLLELRLDLHAPPPTPRWPAGITVRTFQPGVDEEALWRTHQAAFADVPTHLPIARDDLLRDRRPGDDPELVLLAEHGHPHPEVVAIAVCRAGTEFAAEEGWVRDLGVLPSWRRRGVAMALLRAAFAAFRDRGLTGVALEVDDVTLDGAVALYRRAGMRVTRRTDVLERSTPVPPTKAPTP